MFQLHHENQLKVGLRNDDNKDMDLREKLTQLQEELAESEAMLQTLEKQCVECCATIYRLKSHINLVSEEIGWQEYSWKEFDNSQRY